MHSGQIDVSDTCEAVHFSGPWSQKLYHGRLRQYQQRQVSQMSKVKKSKTITRNVSTKVPSYIKWYSRGPQIHQKANKHHIIPHPTPALLPLLPLPLLLPLPTHPHSHPTPPLLRISQHLLNLPSNLPQIRLQSLRVLKLARRRRLFYECFQ